MKMGVSEHRNLALVISGVAALIIGSMIVGSILLYSIQAIPSLTGITEASGCTASLTPKAKTLYVLSRSSSSKTITLSAIGTNGQERWTQGFATLSTPARGSVAEKKGLIYAFITSQVARRVRQQGHIVMQGAAIINIAAAYDANSGKKLWNIQQPPNIPIDGMSICNGLIYLWTDNAIYAYNANNGKPLWRISKLILLNTPRMIITNHAIVFTSIGKDRNHNTIYALNPQKGTLLWKSDLLTKNQNGSFAVLSLTATDKAVYVSQFNKGSPQKVEALSINNGKLLWHISLNMKIDNNSIRSPSTVVNNNVLYLYTSNIGLIALNVNNGTHLWVGSNVNQLQPLQDRLYVTYSKTAAFCQLDPITGKSQWCMSTSSTSNPIEAVSSQTMLYIANSTGVSALHKEDGKIRWVYKNKTPGTSRTLTYALSLDN
jgi:outer membrane protein assembly factor BamB